MESLRKIVRNHYSFFVSESVNLNDFTDFLPEIDTAFRRGILLKDSKSTTAAICEIPGCGSVFLKRTNNKSIRFVLRYLFRRARAFRAAKAILKLKKAGIETPDLLAVGEHRSFDILHGGYLINDYKKDAVDMHRVLLQAENPEQTAARILTEAGRLLSAIHEQNIIHRDCKLANLYFLPDGTCGVWDLDGAVIASAPLTREMILVDLLRLLRGVRESGAQRNDGFAPECSFLCEILAHSYSRPVAAGNVTRQELETAFAAYGK